MDEQKKESETSNIFESFLSSLQTILLNPASFFRGMPLSAGYRSPFLFLMICLVIEGLLSIVFGGRIIHLVSHPLSGIISAGIAVVSIRYVLKKIFDIEVSYEGVFRIISYGSCVVIFASAPLLWLPAALYGILLSIVGTREVYALTSGKAFVAVLLVFLWMNILRFIIPSIVALSPFGLFTA